MGIYSIQPQGKNFSSWGCPLKKNDSRSVGVKNSNNKKYFLVGKEGEKCPITCTCIRLHKKKQHPTWRCLTVSKSEQIRNSLSSSVHRCLLKVSSTLLSTLAFASLLCLACSLFAWSCCERIDYLLRCSFQGKNSSLWILFYFLKYFKDVEHSANI